MSFSNNDQVSFSPCTCWPPLRVLASNRAVSFLAAGSCRRAYRKTLARGPSVFPQAPVFANAIGGRRAAATAWESNTGRGLAGQAGGRRGGGAAGARGRAPELCGALLGLCRLAVAPGSPALVLTVSGSPPALAPAPERGGEPQPGAAVGVCALKDASSRSRVAGGGWRLQFGQRRRLPESRGEDAESHGALLFLVLLLGHRQCPRVWEPRPGLLDRRLQPGCSEQFLRGGVRAGTVRRGALEQAERGGAGWGWDCLQRAR